MTDEGRTYASVRWSPFRGWSWWARPLRSEDIEFEPTRREAIAAATRFMEERYDLVTISSPISVWKEWVA